MAQRVFGPIQGAGVQITEKEGDKPIEAAALGFFGYAGLLEKGPVGELIEVFSPDDFEKRCGKRIADGTLPDAVQHYFSLANGAGGGFLVRVTDGNEIAARIPIYMRRKKQTLLGYIDAHNGGRWGGKRAHYTNDVSGAGSITNTTLTTGIATWKIDQWKGGTVKLNAVPNKTYPIIGNTAAGVITVATDSTMKDDWTAAALPTDFRFYLTLENAGKEVTVEIRDGEEKPDEEFGIFVYVDGVLADPSYPNLSIEPTSARYWINVINDDTNNFEIVASDVFTGTRIASVRPANHYGESTAISATQLTAKIHELNVITSPTGANPTIALGTTNDAMIAQKITLTMTSPTAFSAVSDKFGALGNGTVGSAFTPNNAWTPPFTITNGLTVLATADVLEVVYKPFLVSSLVGGFVYPDKVNAKRSRFRISANTRNTITVVDGSDLTVDGAIGDEFMVVAPLALEGGRDGVSSVVDATYLQKAWDVDASPFNRIAGRGYGLVKFANPGVTSTAVVKGAIAYAAAKNHQARYEIPANVTTESAAEAHVNDTIGRSDYAKVNFPSFGYVIDKDDPEGKRLKLVPLTGMIHGREARIAADFQGYHKAEAGIDAILPEIIKLPTGDKILNEEVLNPKGINVIKKKKGNFILWGDRTVWLDPTWKFAHQRELFSYYEQVLAENFDWIVFAINNAVGRASVKTSLLTFFQPEYAKGALDNDRKFADACVIKIDRENNTNATKAAGDMICDITLAPAETVERLRIRVSKAGIFEASV